MLFSKRHGIKLDIIESTVHTTKAKGSRRGVNRIILPLSQFLIKVGREASSPVLDDPFVHYNT
jgi:hypothetical protein